MGGVLLPGEPPPPPPQADKIRTNSKTPTRIHSPELNEKIDRQRSSAGARRIARQRGTGRVIADDEIGKALRNSAKHRRLYEQVQMYRFDRSSRK
jgi:hypothetical protein